MAINIPFGYWRAKVAKFSLQWFLAVHIPVPLVVFLRKSAGYADLGLTLLLFLAAYFSGQYLGGYLSRRLRSSGQVSSFLFYDLLRRTWIIIIGK